MKDDHKSKDQLIDELILLRRQVADLEASERKLKRAGKAAEADLKRFYALLDGLPGFVFLQGADRSIRYANRRFDQYFGAPKGRACHEVMGCDRMPCERCATRRVLASRSPQDWEWTDAKRQRVFHIFDYPFRDNDGSPMVLELGIDITKQKQIEQVLRESEDSYRTLSSNIPGIVYRVFLLNGRRIQFFNDMVEKMTGYGGEELQSGAHCALGALIIREDRGRVTEVVDRAVGERRPFEVEYRIDHKNGGIRDVIEYGRPVHGADGGLSHIDGVILDVTERKRAVEAVRESEERYREMADLLPQTVFETDLDGNLTFANRAALEAFGYTLQDLVGGLKAIDMLVPEDRERGRKNIAQRLEGENDTDHEYMGLRKDGRRFPVEIYSSQILCGDQPVGLRGIVIDIAGRKKMEQELFKTQKLESLGILAGGIAHDFNNILMAILGNISLARMEAGPNEGLAKRLEAMEKACARARDLAQQLLTFSRGGAPIKKMTSLIDLIRDSASFALRGTGVHCELSIAADLWAAEVDQGQISQVIHNLVLNAVQAMPDGGNIKVTAENVRSSDLLPTSLGGGPCIRISVADQGIGISHDHLSKVFDPYFTTKEKGSGLGLTTAYSVVQRHGGHIGVESEPGGGATFHLYLPATLIGPPKAEEEAPRPMGGKGRILLMDDQEDVRQVGLDILRFLGYEASAARDGEEAVRLYRRAMESGNPYRMVILDLTVPGGMGGKEAAKKLLELDPETKAVVSSGYSGDPVMASYREYGFVGMVTKPYRIQELNEALQEAMEARPGPVV